jgi:peptidoglycan hydrolase FlgJ
VIVDRLSASSAAPHPVETVDAGRTAAAAAARAAPAPPADEVGNDVAARLARAGASAPEIGRAPGLVRHEARKVSPQEKFEAFVLRSFVEEMLPSDENGFFGTGMAGNVWRSMLAEQIGDELAASGGVGIAAMLEKREARPTLDLPAGPDAASLMSSFGAGPAAALADDPET